MSPGVRHRLLSMIQQLRPRATFPFQQSTPALSRKSPRSLSASTVVHSYPRSLAARTTRTFSRKMATFNPDYEHFFRYTSGRWLWDEEQQLRDRYKAFNVAELQIVAAQAIGSGNCVSMMKLAEGGYNKVFRLLMDDGKQVLARIPNPNAGPPFYTTASEVATMQFVSSLIHDKAQEIAYLVARLEIYSKFPFPRCWGGVPHLIIPWVRNTSSWKRRLGPSLQ